MAQATAGTHEHVVSVRTNVVVFVALLALLGLTVLAAQFNLGLISLVIALTIAFCKALLIIMYFMHVRYSSRLAWVMAGAGFVWLAVLIGLTLTDYITRGWFTLPVPPPGTPIG